MKLIDKGYYYDVYDLGNGRVLKKKRNLVWTALFLIFISLKRFMSPLGYLSYFFSMTRKMDENYRKLPKESLLLIGNPVFINAVEYEQDICTILKNILTDMPQEEFMKWVQDYIVLIHDMWRYGYSDLIFNFTVNTGRDSSGKLVQVDFNEITYDKSDVVHQLQAQYWLNNYSYRSLPSSFQDIWRTYAAQELTEQKLNNLWCVLVE